MAFVDQFMVKPGAKVDLSEYDPDYSSGFGPKDQAGEHLEKFHKRLAELRTRLSRYPVQWLQPAAAMFRRPLIRALRRSRPVSAAGTGLYLF